MARTRRARTVGRWVVGVLGVWGLIQLGGVQAQRPYGPGPARAETGQPPMKDSETVLKGLEKVVSTSDGKPSLFTLYVDKKKAEVLVELPKDFEKKKYFIALTVASGELYAGLQEGDLYVTWRKYNNRLALIEPDLETRSTGDSESKSSVARLFTGRVIADVPILAQPPRDGTIINMVELLLVHAPKFFGGPTGVTPKTLPLPHLNTPNP